jgi:hypothetical protein
MATVTWTGGANDGNWATGGNWSGAAAPSSTDDVFLLTTSQDITLGLNQSAITLASLTISRGFGGSIGSASAPLQINVSGTLTYAGSGSYAKINGTIATANIDRTGSGTFYLSGGTWTTTTVSAGRVLVDGAAVLTTFRDISGEIGEIPWNATAITLLENEAGVVVCKRTVTTLTNAAKATTTIEQDGTNAPASTTVNNRGLLRWNSSGTVTTGNNYPAATWDNSQTEYSYTVTTLNDWAGGSFQDTYAGGAVTVGTRNRIGKAMGPALPMV